MIRLYLASPFLVAWLLFVGHAVSKQDPELIPAPQEVKQTNILGYYALDGKDAAGKGYIGTVMVAEIGPNYVFTWLLERGGVCKGVALREGDVLIVGGVQGESLTAFRFTVTEEAGKPKLTGRWAQGSSNGTEVLTLLRRPSL